MFPAFCTIDKNAVSTFANNTYPAKLSEQDNWTLLYHFTPEYAEHSNQDDEQQRNQMQTEEHLIQVKGQQQKQLRITARAPETQQALVQIDMKPNPSGAPEVSVDGQQQQFNQEKAAHAADGYIVTYELPNHEVKVEVGDQYYVIFDGERAKVTATNSDFADSARGLCGSSSADLVTHNNCYVADPQTLIASYTENEQPNLESERECPQVDQQSYAPVVSPSDWGAQKSQQRDSQHKPQSSSNGCTKYQAQYRDEGHQVCFSIRPLPACKSPCQPQQIISKNAPVHCVANRNLAQRYMEHINKGANPDFSGKPQSKSISFQVPASCAH